MTEPHIHPVLGIGFGPANLSVAVALEELGCAGHAHFIERAPGFQWQEELLLSGADIQNNPFRDLAMPRNPDSPHTFVRYLATRGTLTEYLHLNLEFPLRREYAGYLGWVAEAFRDAVDYGQRAIALSLVERPDGDGEVFRVETEAGRRYLAESIVLGTGRSPRVPPEFQARVGPTVFHSTRYLSAMAALARRDLHVAVVGASQSAIEILLDLVDRPEVRRITSIHRGIGFRLKDTSPYSRRAFLPEFIDYFHPLPSAAKRRLRAELRSTNYEACDEDVIDRLARVQYEYELMGSDRLQLLPFTQVVQVTPADRGHRLLLRDVNNGTRSACDADVVVLATGFRDFGPGPDEEPIHPLLAGVRPRLAADEQGLPVVARDYSVAVEGTSPGTPPPRLYINGLCEASHGMGDAGAQAVLSARASDIAGSIVRQPDRSDRRQPAAVEAV